MFNLNNFVGIILVLTVTSGQLVPPNGYYITKIPVSVLQVNSNQLYADDPSPEEISEQTTEEMAIATEPITTQLPVSSTTTEMSASTMAPVEVTPYDPDICSKSSQISVCADCDKISVCLDGEMLEPKQCTSSTPYCTETSIGSFCSSVPDANRLQCQTKFRCSSTGAFPDPFHCQYYYNCNDNMRASKYDCNPGYSFDPARKECRRIFLPRDCNVVDCSRENGIWSYYGSNRQYYAYCYKRQGADEVAVFKCSDGAEFDGNTCVFRCRSTGRFPDTLNRNKYYDCYFSGLRLVHQIKSCDQGLMFDPTSKVCV